ncbi:hypothetical protein EG68_10141, partial [Paragonimus skrjabini miyazakii]
DNTSPNTEGGAEENSKSSESVETVSPEVTDEITPVTEPDGETADGSDESETVNTEPDTASSTEDNTSPNTEGGAEENSKSSESVETVSPEVTDEITPVTEPAGGTSPFLTISNFTPEGENVFADVSPVHSVIPTDVPAESHLTELNNPESTEPAAHEVARFDGRGELNNIENTTPTDIHDSTDVSGADRLLSALTPIDNGTLEKSSATIHHEFTTLGTTWTMIMIAFSVVWCSLD